MPQSVHFPAMPFRPNVRSSNRPFVDTGLAAGLLGLTVANGIITDRLYRPWSATGLLSVVLLVRSTSTAASTRRPAHSKDDPGALDSERIGVTSGGVDHEPHP